MRSKLDLGPAAPESEARSAFLWYLARNPVAAQRLQAAVEACIDAIADAPERNPEVEPGGEPTPPA